MNTAMAAIAAQHVEVACLEAHTTLRARLETPFTRGHLKHTFGHKLTGSEGETRFSKNARSQKAFTGIIRKNRISPRSPTLPNNGGLGGGGGEVFPSSSAWQLPNSKQYYSKGKPRNSGNVDASLR